MLDFVEISYTMPRKGEVVIYPKFIVCNSKDLMIKGGDFYAYWCKSKNSVGSWSTDEQDLIDEIDEELRLWYKENRSKFEDCKVRINYMRDSDSGVIDKWHKYCQRQMRDRFTDLDTKLIFANQKTVKSDYSTKSLPYSLEEGSTEAYDELMSALYSDVEMHKINWCIGSIISGDSTKKSNQKFLVIYGPPGAGKGTVISIMQMLFDGYSVSIDADSLGSASAPFALEQLKTNPIVAFSGDCNLSNIEKNNVLNGLVSHEEILVNEKHKSTYTLSFRTFLVTATNNPLKVTDAKSGLTRRVIDAMPLGKKIPYAKYVDLLGRIKFELGAIAQKCKEIYLEDRHYYDDYRPINMLEETNDFYNFIEEYELVFAKQDGVSLKQAWDLYNAYCEDAKVRYPFPKKTFKVELKAYFENYSDERVKVGEEWVRNYYSGFKNDLLKSQIKKQQEKSTPSEKIRLISFKEHPDDYRSCLDVVCANCKAQLANDEEHPRKKWENVTTTLSDINPKDLHYVRPPENLIVIDFDLKDENGNKSFERNLQEASKWPKTYAELSKSGNGIHLHYFYTGEDVKLLNRIYAEDIEIKVFSGNSSLRRKLTKCNDEMISIINSGLPLRDKKDMLDFKSVQNEKALRTIIYKNLNKEYHGATKPSIDFIYQTLEDAYKNGLRYDVSDLMDNVLNFAAGSTHNAEYCITMVSKMHFKSDELPEDGKAKIDRIVFYDVEVFPNLFLINWKFEGSENKVVRMINPTKEEVASLFKYKLVGFNNRRYDNHILWARYMGYDNLALYELSQDIINSNGKRGLFNQAYNISYTDIYDYSVKKQSLKKWEAELDIHHKELGLPWDKPVSEDLWEKVAEYCDNDVIATEAVWNATKSDFTARCILAEIAEMSVNDTTNSLSTKIILNGDKNPDLVYVDLSKEFPGYEFKKTWNNITNRYDKFNMYRGIDLGFGGYVYAEKGMYTDVALLDIASMHPHSMKAMNIFGKYTDRFYDLVNIRVLIKHKEYEKVKTMLDGKLAKYLGDEGDAKGLAQALKIAINSIYGLTSANFPNAFRDPRNENNIVALRGALFMKTLQDEVQRRGFTVVHIKTDSIKIANATSEIIDFCMNFAKRYGYTFEHEATYEKICLVNDAVYIAKYKDGEHDFVLSTGEVIRTAWTATGKEFQVPYVFKTCFSKSPINFRDLCEIKEVHSAIHIDMDENLGENDHDYRFVGRVGLFCPIKPGCGGGRLVREQKKPDGTIGLDSVTGTKGYRWLESETVYELNKQDDIDRSYYDLLVNEAIDDISQYGDYEWFVNDDGNTGCEPLIMKTKDSGAAVLYDTSLTCPTGLTNQKIYEKNIQNS